MGGVYSLCFDSGAWSFRLLWSMLGDQMWCGRVRKHACVLGLQPSLWEEHSRLSFWACRRLRDTGRKAALAKSPETGISSLPGSPQMDELSECLLSYTTTPVGQHHLSIVNGHPDEIAIDTYWPGLYNDISSNSRSSFSFFFFKD